MRASGFELTDAGKALLDKLEDVTDVVIKPTGASMSHTDLYIALYSLYMQTATERDSKVGGN